MFLQVEYRVKWENFSNQHNTWEPSKNLEKCTSDIEEFESKWADCIIGMNGHNFRLRFKCGEIREITFSEAKMKWPNLLIIFVKNA